MEKRNIILLEYGVFFVSIFYEISEKLGFISETLKNNNGRYTNIVCGGDNDTIYRFI